MSEDTHLFDTDEHMKSLNEWSVTDQLKQIADNAPVKVTINDGHTPDRQVSITVEQLARWLSDL